MHSINNNYNLFYFLTTIASVSPDKCLLKDSRRTLCAKDLLRFSVSIANFMSGIGIQKGSVVSFFITENIPGVIVLLALRFLGCLVILCDKRQSLSEIQSSCENELPIAFSVSLQDCVITITVPQNGISTDISVDITDCSICDNALIFPEFDTDYSPYDPSFVLFTSGSTGDKKAVVLSEYNLIHNLEQSKDPGNCLSTDTAILLLPLDHVFGLALLTGVFVIGYALFFPEHMGTDSLLKDIQREHITRMNAVPSIYLRLCEKADEYDLSSLRCGFIAGAPTTQEQFYEIEEKLGITLVPVYGMTECVGITCGNYRDERSVRAVSVGKPYSSNSLKILDENGCECSPGLVGEICVNGPMKMSGYYGQPGPFDKYLHTGDLGFISSEEYLYLCGRKKDIIIRNGNNLSAKRIESALLSMESVREAVVVGIPDYIQGEVPCAMIVGYADLSLLQNKLHKNEYPVKILSVPVLPTTGSGKPDKQIIRKVLQEHD